MSIASIAELREQARKDAQRRQQEARAEGQRLADRPAPASEQKMKLFHHLRKLIEANGGTVTSPPGDVLVRFEAPLGSAIATNLAAIKMQISGGAKILPLKHLGTAEKIVDGRIVPVRCYAFLLG